MSRSKPLNILHLFTDQMRFDAIAAHGNPHIHTPHLDWLIEQGVSFQRAYSPSPECVPARCCMITGHYPGRTQCYSNSQPMPPENEPTFMSRLKDAGYDTHGIGKCHFTPNSFALRGFVRRETQEELPQSRKNDDYASHLVKSGWGWVLEPHGVRGEMYYVPQVSLLPESKHPTRWVGDRSIAYIKKQKSSSKPWYLYSSFIHPHPPFAPPVPWHKDYRGPDMPLPDIPENREDLLCFINRKQNRYKYRDHGGLDLNLIRQMRAYYYACVSFIDAQVGRILEALKTSGQLEKTLILFSSDHGEYLGDYGSFGKRGMHDASARIPLIVRWPDKAMAGKKANTPASLVDLAPTFLDAAGVTFSESDYDGVSLRRLAEGTLRRDTVFSQYNHGSDGLYMAVTRNWKYIFSAPDQKEFFFNLKRDPKEHHNLIAASEHQAELKRIRKRCLSWVASTKQTHAVAPNGFWAEYPIRKLPDDPDEGLIYQDPAWWNRNKANRRLKAKDLS